MFSVVYWLLLSTCSSGYHRVGVLELAMLASHVISHVTVGIFVVVYSWVDPINTLCSSAHHDCQQFSLFPSPFVVASPFSLISILNSSGPACLHIYCPNTFSLHPIQHNRSLNSSTTGPSGPHLCQPVRSPRLTIVSGAPDRVEIPSRLQQLRMVVVRDFLEVEVLTDMMGRRAKCIDGINPTIYHYKNSHSHMTNHMTG